MATCIDPVCGQRIESSRAGVEALLSQRNGKTCYFCSPQCKQEFDRNADAYTLVTDRVCGCDIVRERAEKLGLSMEHQGERYWFCSDDCRQRFELAPGFYSQVPQTENVWVEERPSDGSPV